MASIKIVTLLDAIKNNKETYIVFKAQYSLTWGFGTGVTRGKRPTRRSNFSIFLLYPSRWRMEVEGKAFIEAQAT